MQFSYSFREHKGMKTPLSSSSYHTAVPFRHPLITITVHNLTCYYSPGVGFTPHCPHLCSSFLLFHRHTLPSSFHLLWLEACIHVFLSFALFSIPFFLSLVWLFFTSLLAHVNCIERWMFFLWLLGLRVYNLAEGNNLFISQPGLTPLFLESRFPLKVYFQGKSGVLFCAHIGVPFPPHQFYVKVFGWETQPFEKHFFGWC